MKFIGKDNVVFDTSKPEEFVDATIKGGRRIPGGVRHRFPKFNLTVPNIPREKIPPFIYNIMGEPRSKIMELLLIAADQRPAGKPKEAVYSCGDELDVILRCKLRGMDNESFKPMDNQGYILVYNIKDPLEFSKISKTLEFLSKKTKGYKFILVGVQHSALPPEEVSTADLELKQLAKQYNAQSTIINLKIQNCIQPLKQIIEQPCKDIQAKYRQEEQGLAFTHTIAKQPIYFTQFEAQKSRRNWQIFGIVVAAFFFTPLSLLATVPLFIWAQNRNPIKELEIDSKDYRAVKRKRKQWYAAIASELKEGDLEASKIIKPKKIKDKVNCGEKSRYFMDKAQYERFKLFEDHDLDYLRKNVTLEDIKHSKEESLEIMRGLQLTI